MLKFISKINSAHIDLARPWRSLQACISDSIIDTDLKQNLDRSLKIDVKIYWTKSNFPPKLGFKSNEDENKYSPAFCEGIVTLYLFYQASKVYTLILYLVI